ncbi:MAG: PAS domain S-box protein [Limnothrix sp. RL_2_0]|nr:PAS domain S-box protein [Limnothrix sp. RL_2_0]
MAHDITPIKQTQQELFQHQQALEAKVKDRTKQLQTINKALQAEVQQRQQMETALRHEQDFLATIFNLAGALLVILDREGNIVRFNPTCETLTGFTAAEVLGQQVSDFLLCTEDIPLMEEELRRLLREKTSNMQDLAWRSKKGQIHHISWKNTVLLDADGEVKYIIAAGMDTSDRQTLERTLKTLNQELETRVEQRTQSLNAIQQNLRRQLAAVDAAVEAIAILQQGKFVSVNTAFLELFGYPHLVSLSDHSWDILLAPEEHPRITTEILPQLDAAGSWQGKAIAHRPDGSTFTQEISLTITPDQDLICVCRDITTREADAAKLRATETLLRSQYNNFPIPTYTWQHRDHNFYLINYNAAANIANDNQLDIFIGHTSREVYGREHAIHLNIRHCFLTKTSFEEELPTQYRSQKQQRLLLRYLIVTYVYIEPDMVMIHTQDLTERKRAEAELEQNQAFLRQVIDNDPNLIFVKDEDGQFLLANTAVANLYGTTVKELVGKTDAEFNGETDELERFNEADRRVLISQKPLLIPEEKMTDFRGEVHYFRTMKIPLKINNEKNCSRILGVASEITQIRQAQLQLEQSLAQERELNLLKTNFIDTASHEFRTPLTVILGATDILTNYHEKLSAERRDRTSRISKLMPSVSSI